MSQELYHWMQENSGFKPVNRDRGLELSEDRSPEASYNLPNGEVRLYSHSPSLKDILHPFRPSGTVIAEVVFEMDDLFYEMYLNGTDEDFETFDENVMQMLEEEQEPEYCKKIL